MYTVISSLFLITLPRKVLSGVTTGGVEFQKFVSQLPKSWAHSMAQGTPAPGRQHGMSDIWRKIAWHDGMVFVHHGLKNACRGVS